MSSRWRFELFCPCHYSLSLGVTGKLGGRPDTEISGGREPGCVRSVLPGFLEDLTFVFPRLPDGTGELIQNFYHHGEFLVVANRVKDFLCASIPASDLQISPISMHHNDGREASDRYFAVKIVRTIDCISADTTFYRRDVPFSKALTIYELQDGLRAEFANTDDGKYVSYPDILNSDIRKIDILDHKIPEDVRIFRPKFWPRFSMVETGFAARLESLCAGGFSGHYFWTLNLEDVNASLDATRLALR